MKAKTAQATKIILALEDGAELTALDALRKFDCFRLAARVSDLRNEGYDIRTRMVEIDSGKKIAQYFLAR